jgi:uncharacterized RDD family membrane protein YckC/outer membrane lipoprotein-sorting protein
MLTNSLGQAPRYAGFWDRFLASLIDYVPILIMEFFIPEDSKSKNLCIGVFYWIYMTALESSSWQASIGKKVLGLKVTDEAGNRIGFGRANARFWSKVLSGILCIGYIMVAFTKKKQGLHDKIAGTFVLKDAPPIGKTWHWILGVIVAYVIIGTLTLTKDDRNGSMPIAATAVVTTLHTSPSPSEIITESKQKYASLLSYEGTGKTIEKNSKGTSIISSYMILSRPDLYRVEWKGPLYSGAAWSAGEGGFIYVHYNNGSVKYEKKGSREMTLAATTGVSNSATATVPAAFFKQSWGDPFSADLYIKKGDEKIDGVDCFVLVHDGDIITGPSTLKIGKADFLIRQYQWSIPILDKTETETQTYKVISINKLQTKKDFMYVVPNNTKPN